MLSARLRETRLEERRQFVELVLFHVAIDVGGDVLDANPAAELLAEERDVAADDRAEIEQRGVLARLQQLEELGERLGGIRGLVGDGGASLAPTRPRGRGGPRRSRTDQSAIGWRRSQPTVLARTLSRRCASAPTFCASTALSGCGAAGRRRRLRGAARPAAGLAPRALHVDAAAEMRALGDGHARRDDVAVDRAVVANVDLLRRRHVADDFAQHDRPPWRTLPRGSCRWARWSARFRAARSGLRQWPSIVRSSLPLSSPLMTTDFPIFTLSLSIWGRTSTVGCGAAARRCGAAGGAAGAGGGGVGLTDSSRFHIS